MTSAEIFIEGKENVELIDKGMIAFLEKFKKSDSYLGFIAIRKKDIKDGLITETIVLSNATTKESIIFYASILNAIDTYKKRFIKHLKKLKLNHDCNNCDDTDCDFYDKV